MLSPPRILLTLLIGVAVYLAAAEHQPQPGGDDGPVLEAIRVDRISRRMGPRGLEPAQTLHRRLTLHGRGFRRASGGPAVNFRFDDGRNVPSPLVIWVSDRKVTAWVPELCRGTARVELRNPDNRRTSLIVDL
jgi:hypothetical protein